MYIDADLINQLPTYQLSQDSLECLFSRIRSLNGNCENPPVTMFTSALRKILLHNEITASKSANCTDNLKIFSAEMKQKYPTDLPKFGIGQNSREQGEDDEQIQMFALNENDFLMDCTQEATIASIAASIEQKILNAARFQCDCVHVLVENEKVVGLTISSDSIPPCISTVYVCKIANICFNLCRNQLSFDYNLLLEKIMGTINFDNVFEQYFRCDISHKKGFIKYIVEEFIRLQANYIAKNLTLIEQKILCRKVLQKKVHFRGQ